MITGRVWKFSDNINTDLILPGHLLHASEEEQWRATFSAHRPGWVDQVQRGDIVLAGENFGTGSSRPAARSLRNLGIACTIADSLNGLFLRGCVTFGLLALECPGISKGFEEGQSAEVSLDDFRIRNMTTGAVFTAQPLPRQLLDMMRSGGLFPLLEAEGLLSRPESAAPRSGH